MSDELSINSILADLCAHAERSDDAALQERIRQLEVALSGAGGSISVGDISGSTAVAIGENIQLVVNQNTNLPTDLLMRLSVLADALNQRARAINDPFFTGKIRSQCGWFALETTAIIDNEAGYPFTVHLDETTPTSPAGYQVNILPGEALQIRERPGWSEHNHFNPVAAIPAVIGMSATYPFRLAIARSGVFSSLMVTYISSNSTPSISSVGDAVIMDHAFGKILVKVPWFYLLMSIFYNKKGHFRFPEFLAALAYILTVVVLFGIGLYSMGILASLPGTILLLLLAWGIKRLASRQEQVLQKIIKAHDYDASSLE